MFGLGILSYLKIGAAVAVIAVGTFFFINYNRMQTKIATLEMVVAQQTQAIEFYQKSQAIDVDTKAQKEEAKKIIDEGNPQKIIDFFERMKKLSQNPEGDE